MDALKLGATAWEDQGTLTWPVFIDQELKIPGGVNVEVEAKVTGPFPYSKTSLGVFPVSTFDLEKQPTLGVAKGI